MSKPRVLILRAAGTNCDRETAFAFEKAGAAAEYVHIGALLARPALLHEFDLLAIPGGFTYGDDIASGKVLANQIRLNLLDDVRRFVGEGKLVLGICNGFQVLVKARLIPRLDPGPAGQECTLTFNDSGKFEARWIHLAAVSGKSPFVREGDRFHLPVAHGEGKFMARDPAILDRLERGGQVVLRYAGQDGGEAPYPWNPNGSERAIAGVCDESGRILGLMPHPERHIEGTQHPRFTREGLKEEGDGMRIFRNAVAYLEK